MKNTNKLKPKKRNSLLLFFVIISFITLFITLPFHYLYIYKYGEFKFIKVLKKSNLSFDRTFMEVDEINKIIDQYNNASPFEKTILKNDVFLKKILALSAEYSKEQETINEEYKNFEKAQENLKRSKLNVKNISRPNYLPKEWVIPTLKDINVTRDDLYWIEYCKEYNKLPFMYKTDLDLNGINDTVWILKNKKNKDYGIFVYLNKNYKLGLKFILHEKENSYYINKNDKRPFLFEINDLFLKIEKEGEWKDYNYETGEYKMNFYEFPQIFLSRYETHSTIMFMYNKKRKMLVEKDI